MTFDYTSRDYETIRRDLLARASRVLPEWTDRDPSDFGMLLLDLWSYVGDGLHYYIDRAAGESYLPTATQRESVLAFANLLDYIPQGRTSAAGTVSLQNSSVFDYEVEPYTEFVARVDEKTYTVYTVDGGSVAAASPGVLLIQEGQPYVNETLTDASDGTPGQRYSLPRERVVPSSVRVFVYENGIDATEYVQVPRLSAAPNGDRVFSTYVNAERELEIVFGSTLSGYVPPTGSAIKVNYVVSSGAEGNLPANVVTSFKYGSPSDILITGNSSLSGGVDEESIDSMKESIPSVISAQNRAVTRRDFIAMTNQIAGVAKTAIEFTQGSGSADNTVTIYPQPNRSSDYLTTSDTSQTISSQLQDEVVAAVQPKALMGVVVECASSISWQEIDITMEVFVNSRYVSNFVRRDVEAAIDRLFSFDNVQFGQLLPIGQVYRLVLNVPGVDYVDITIFDVSGETDREDTIQIPATQLPKKGEITITMTGGITTS